MPKHIYITKEMLESKLNTISVRDLAKSWAVSESTITRMQAKFGLTRPKNSKLSSNKIRKYKISSSNLSSSSDVVSYIFGFLYARGKIYKSALIIQCPIKQESINILQLINSTFESTYPIIQTKKSVKITIRDKQFIDKLVELKVLNGDRIIKACPNVSDREMFENGISLSLSMTNTIISDKNEEIIELLKTHNATEVAKLMNLSVSRIRKIKKQFKLFEQ